MTDQSFAPIAVRNKTPVARYRERDRLARSAPRTRVGPGPSGCPNARPAI